MTTRTLEKGIEYYSANKITELTGITRDKIKTIVKLHGIHLDAVVIKNITQIPVNKVQLLVTIQMLYCRGLNVVQVERELKNGDSSIDPEKVKAVIDTTNINGNFIKPVDMDNIIEKKATVGSMDSFETVLQLNPLSANNLIHVKKFAKDDGMSGISRFQLFYAFYNKDFPVDTYFYCKITNRVCQFTKYRIYDCLHHCGLTTSFVIESWCEIEPPYIASDGRVIIIHKLKPPIK